MNADKFKEIIDKLRGINIQDLQNIDMRQVVEVLQRRVDIIVSVLLVLVTLVVTVTMGRGNAKKSQVLDYEIKQMRDRLEAVNESDRVKGEYAAFQKNFPFSMTADELVNRLSEFAAARDVQMVSFAPDKESSDDYVQVARVQINISATDYPSLVLFMKDIETAPYALRVEQWSAKMREIRSKEGANEIKKNIIEANMKIGSVTLKYE
ncbi:MAG: type 4a pilus biogenesis protein PilO [Candidatus Omnitrophica bacterium]|nr:type 4a pilus biogenesis protein PilO [Candidatus Omnitrophota bacterium]